MRPKVEIVDLIENDLKTKREPWESSLDRVRVGT